MLEEIKSFKDRSKIISSKFKGLKKTPIMHPLNNRKEKNRKGKEIIGTGGGRTVATGGKGGRGRWLSTGG